METSYLLKCKGISEFHENKFDKAIQTFGQAIPVLEGNKDFAWASVVDFYIGKSYLGLHKEDEAVQQFKKLIQYSRNIISYCQN